VAAGAYKSIEEAQAGVCLPFRTIEPDRRSVDVYDRLYTLYKDVYFALGQRHAPAVPLGRVLPELREIASKARQSA
jgi:L-ribulokinase